MLERLFVATVAAMTTVLGSGCPIGALIPESQTTVRLVNNADFDVEVQLFYHDDQNVLEEILEEVGTEINRTLAPGDAVSISRDCDDLQAVFIRDADLNIVGGLGPEADTDVFRDGSDFGCGDTITFTFTQNDLATELNINVSVTE